jgi:hypothetical protein
MVMLKMVPGGKMPTSSDGVNPPSRLKYHPAYVIHLNNTCSQTWTSVAFLDLGRVGTGLLSFSQAYPVYWQENLFKKEY